MELSYKTVSAILERWSDEGIVTDHCSEYGEPGYGRYVARNHGCSTTLHVQCGEGR